MASRLASLFCLLVFHLSSLYAQPSITSVVNAASNADPAALNGPIAQGSTFIVYGSGLGPDIIAVASSYPLPTTLSGTTATVSIGGSTVNAILLYSLSTQIAAILPSSTPIGTGTITVNYGGQASAASPITVVQSSFGTYTISQNGTGVGVFTFSDYSLVTNTKAANPGETLLIWGTGLGPVTGNEASGPLPGNISSISTKVFVGLTQAAVTYQGRSGCCSGLDQIAFVVPSGVTGCTVPVAIQTGSVVSNFTTISIAASGRTCSDPSTTTIPPIRINPVLRLGEITLSRSSGLIYAPTGGTSLATSTSSIGFFVNESVPAGTPSPVATGTTIPAGTCLVSSVSSGALDPTPVAPTVKYLDAGKVIAVSSGAGGWQMPFTADGQLIYYMAQPTGDYSGAGTYTFTGSGGADVGPFNVSINVPQALALTNQSTLTTIDRSVPLTLSWTGGAANSTIDIIGYSTANAQLASSAMTFECTARADDKAFTIPTFILQSLPPTATSSAPLGQLVLINNDSQKPFNATGIDIGFITSSSGTSSTVTYK